MENNKKKFELQFDDKGRVILNSWLMVRSLLDDLLREGIINVTTYVKAVREVEIQKLEK